ncbi:MAG: hypothetical protein JXR25_08475 [Pontiellaceae bacterium]|nr:hypothetical protein [Pontiellaceae bacterium]MBN2784849.1 hypothetical protein [Pontiellaceae bacterium]
MKSGHPSIRTALFIGMVAASLQAVASREMENLDRGVIATYRSYPSSLVYVGWRMLGTEPDDVGYNVYRGNTKLNATPITSSCNYLDNSGTASSTYSVAAVIDGVEQERSDPVETWNGSYLGSGAFMGCQPLTLTPRDGYHANDASVGDLDGDGAYELVIKRLYATDNTTAATTTHFHYIEAYEMDGTLLWSINLGPNNIFPVNGVEINPIVYDFDGDGRAEVVLRTTDGAIDGQGKVIGSATADYRSSAVDNSGLMWMTQGDEFISVFDGQTGAEIARADYIERDPITQWGYDSNLSRNAHRADKCMMTPAYLDGETPSLVICRGIYEKIALEAWSFRNGTLARQWTFSSDNWPGYARQGNHNMTVGDVDGDGKDEIVYASMCVDDDGTGLYTTGLGHGDALHMSDMIPSRPGLEVFAVHEHDGYGSTLRDAGTGEILWQYEAAGDTGRGCAAHIDSDYPGYQMWSVGTEGKTYDATTKDMVSTTQPNWGNFLIWWDGDLQREILDTAGSEGSPIINKWDSANNSGYRLISLYNYPSSYASTTINSTKANPCLSGDLFGDWREEAIYPSSDHTKLYIFSTCTVANNRIYTLMHDSQYRTAIAWQCNQYNQPPHPSFYIGAGMDAPPTPDIVLVEADTTPPAAPTGLAAAFADNGIELSWTDNSETDFASYTVYRSTVSGTGYSAIASNLTAGVLSDSALESSTTYYYVVTATDRAQNESEYSTETYAKSGILLTPQANPVAFYRFEEGAAGSVVSGDVIDSAGADDNMSTTGTTAAPAFSANVPADTIPQIGQPNQLSATFDGSDALYHAITGPAVTATYSSFTVEAYVNFSSLNGFQTIVGRDDTSSSTGGVDGDSRSLLYLSKHYDGHFRIETLTDGADFIMVESSVNPALNTWYHIAAVGDADAGTLTLYINGTEAGSASGFDGLYPSTTLPWSIGRGMYNGAQVDFVSGSIDEVRITDSALAPDQFLNAFNSDSDGDGLLDTWELENFGNLNQSGTDDFDGDGDNNATEQANGTSPRISSAPPMLHSTINSDQSLTVDWSTNHIGWHLEWKTNLVDGEWVTIPDSTETNEYTLPINLLPWNSTYFRLVYP